MGSNNLENNWYVIRSWYVSQSAYFIRRIIMKICKKMLKNGNVINVWGMYGKFTIAFQLIDFIEIRRRRHSTLEKLD